jgi:carbamoyltransferase
MSEIFKRIADLPPEKRQLLQQLLKREGLNISPIQPISEHKEDRTANLVSEQPTVQESSGSQVEIKTICGVKLTHDGTIALIDDGKLVFSIELEKLDNNPRFKAIEDISILSKILKEYGYDIKDIDKFVIDGWGWEGLDKSSADININNKGQDLTLNLASYQEKNITQNVLEENIFSGLKVDEAELEYSSYMHVTGHILSAYCTSPFAFNNESSFILVWDGGMLPRLYYFNAETKRIENLGSLFLLHGNIYAIFARHFEPFNHGKKERYGGLSVAGKVMAYIALGHVRDELIQYFTDVYESHLELSIIFGDKFATEFKKRIDGQTYKSEDILKSFHVFLENLLVKKLALKINQFRNFKRNLCFAGGCALNIKWNSAIRNSQIFDEIWIPPFPNDTGSALGMACCSMLKNTKIKALDWNVYKGPNLIKTPPAEGWIERDCSIKQLARLLHETEEPVVFLNGRAELGPRALGNRSILASARSPKMKDILNQAKGRESYRPVAPLCLEHRAPEIFTPGSRDPYMLFDHVVRREWVDSIPAICHLDGTARLQTVNSEENQEIAELLMEYEKISGIPVLCNTSANFNGCGFFPDIYSATTWGKVNYVWSNYVLYEKEEKVKLI